MATGTQPSTSVIARERKLQQALCGVRIVAELGVDRADVEQLHADLEQLAGLFQQQGWGDPDFGHFLAKRFPAIFVTYLVGVGIHEADGGRFWPYVMSAIQAAPDPGECFKHALRRLGLHDFNEVVEEDRAQPYVGRILAHAGIPRTCAYRFLAFLEQELRRNGGCSAEDLLVEWRSERTRLDVLHNPARRFLLYGGAPAQNLLDRCIDFISDAAREGRVPEADAHGLPAYIVDAYRQVAQGVGSSEIPEARVHAPYIELTHADNFGPVAVLPPAAESGGRWRVSTGSAPVVVDASMLRESRVGLFPAPSWQIDYEAPDGLRRQWLFEAFGRIPVLFADPDDGRIVRDPAIIGLPEVLMLRPASVELNRVGDGTGGWRTTLPSPAGAWRGYLVEHLDLRGTRCLGFTRIPDGHQWRHVVVRQSEAKPELVGSAVEGVAASSGGPVFSAMPTLKLPANDLPPHQWRFELRVRGGARPMRFSDPDDVSSGSIDLARWAPSHDVGEYHVTARGPLGSDLSAAFTVVEGLSVQRPPHLVLPSDERPAVRVKAASTVLIDMAAPGEPVTIPCQRGTDRVEVKVSGHDGRTSALTIHVPTLLWSVAHETKLATALDAEVVRVGAEEFDDALADVLTVKVGKPDVEMALSLRADDQVLHETPWVRSGPRDGRWSFDLGEFSDIIRSTNHGRLTFFLRVGIEDVPLVVIVPPVVVHKLRIVSARFEGRRTTASVRFEQERLLPQRVLRLWSLDRPWAEPVEEQIADGAHECTVTREGDLPPGSYFAEVALDDPWLKPRFPRAGSAQGSEVAIGSRQEIAAYRGGLDPRDPHQALEALMTNCPVEPEVLPSRLAELGDAGVRCVLHLVPKDLIGRPLRPLRRICEWLWSNPNALLKGLAELNESGDAAQDELLRLQLVLLREMPPMARCTDQVLDELWREVPIMAAALDRNFDEPSLRRRARFMHPSLLTSDPDIATGGAVRQEEAGRSATELRDLRQFLALVPQSELDDASLQLAMFEWLIAQVEADGQVSNGLTPARWMASVGEFVHSLPPSAPPQLVAHVAARAWRPGTVEWAAFPQGVLVAAAHLVCRNGARDLATRALAHATSFAPRLVQHDVLLVYALNGKGSGC